MIQSELAPPFLPFTAESLHGFEHPGHNCSWGRNRPFSQQPFCPEIVGLTPVSDRLNKNLFHLGQRDQVLLSNLIISWTILMEPVFKGNSGQRGCRESRFWNRNSKVSLSFCLFVMTVYLCVLISLVVEFVVLSIPQCDTDNGPFQLEHSKFTFRKNKKENLWILAAPWQEMKGNQPESTAAAGLHPHLWGQTESAHTHK